MIISENGIVRDMTAEELAEFETITMTESDYALKVESLIREKYSVSDELAILRQRDTKPEEFAQYFGYCEDCKARAKEDGA